MNALVFKVTLAKLAHRGVVNISNAAALDTLPRIPKARELRAVLVEVILQIVVNAFLHVIVETLLVLGIAVAKVMTLAAGDEVIAIWLIRGFGTVIGGPDALGRVIGISRFLEAIHGCLEEKLVGDRIGAGGCAAFKVRQGSESIGLN
jgi:hypothetical protein